MRKAKESKILSFVLAFVLAIFVLSASIAVPILCRPFYYAHIDLLRIVETTGIKEEVIRRAYDDVLDYCTGKTETFSAGNMPFSESGANHFADVKRLFLLDFWAAGISLVLLAGLIAYAQLYRVRPKRILGHNPWFWGATGLGGALVIVGGLAAIDFNKAFVVFHTLFFPGKDNWKFNWIKDPVILILPQDFFRNCTILALFLVLFSCGILIIFDIITSKKRITK